VRFGRDRDVVGGIVWAGKQRRGCETAARGDRSREKRDMKDERKQETDLRDKDKADEERPIPSQAEGDLETIEADLKQKGKQGSAFSRKGEERKA
jgi:hypothetical protein